MSELNPLNGPIVFVAYPDPESTSYVTAVLNAAGQSFQAVALDNLNSLYEQLGQLTDSAIVVSELIWDGQDASDVLLTMALNFPRVSFVGVTNADISSFVPPFFPIPCIQGIEDVDAWLGVVNSLTEDLRTTDFGNYQLKDFAGQSHLGRVYDAYQPAIRRDVQLILLPSNATEDEQESFRQIAAARAGNTHPLVYAIYEEGKVDGRSYVSMEPVKDPTLLQYSLQNSKFETRLLAKIINATSTTLKHYQLRSLPFQPLRSSHVTVSSTSVIKCQNTALPVSYRLPDMAEQLAILAYIIRDFINPEEAEDPNLAQLLSEMEEGSIPLEQVILRSQKIDLDLAPVKYVPQRQEAVIAQQQVVKARRNFWISTISGVVALVALLIFLISTILDSFVIVPPGKDFKKQLAIPPGQVTLANSKSFDVGGFYMDEYEVTIGQYAKFLEAVKGKDVKEFLPKVWNTSKESFEPMDWDEIQKSIKKKKPYEGEVLTNDSPVFNVDYGDAWAYAKWAGKRLPTELEWIRAASGNDQYKFPWGNESDLKMANTGVDKNPNNSTGSKAGSEDGFRGPNPVDEKESDQSPFGVKGMGGNVSEWVQPSSELGKIKQDAMPYKGSNHMFGQLVSNQSRLGDTLTVRNPAVGFRCASDEPVSK